MTRQEYDAKMDAFGKQLKENYSEELYEQVSEFQSEYMNNLLDQYKDKIGGDKAKMVCYELLEYAINHSESGSSCEYLEDKETWEKVEEIIWDELGEFMLDFPEFYEENGEYVVDCVFAGNYVPYWDGWCDG